MDGDLLNHTPESDGYEHLAERRRRTVALNRGSEPWRDQTQAFNIPSESLWLTQRGAWTFLSFSRPGLACVFPTILIIVVFGRTLKLSVGSLAIHL